MSEMLLHAGVMILGVIAAGFSQLLLKKAALQTHKHWIFQYLNARVVFGYAIMVLSFHTAFTLQRLVSYLSGSSPQNEK